MQRRSLREFAALAGLAMTLLASPTGAEPARPTEAETRELAEEPAALVADAAAGAAKAVLCAGCHGPDGNAVAPMWPNLAQQQSGYILKQLRDFRAGRRVDATMTAMVAMLTDQDMVNLAAHFEGQELRLGSGQPELAAAGKQLYTEGRAADGVPPCLSCHGPRGEGFIRGIDGGFPALGGQNVAYIAKQLQSFRSSARGNDWSEIMRFVAVRLTDRDIAAVSQYLVGLPRTEAEQDSPQDATLLAAGSQSRTPASSSLPDRP